MNNQNNDIFGNFEEAALLASIAEIQKIGTRKLVPWMFVGTKELRRKIV